MFLFQIFTIHSLILFLLQGVDGAWIEARRNPIQLSPVQAYGQLMKRDFQTHVNGCLPALTGVSSCDGFTKCTNNCCAADEACCNPDGCRPLDSTHCSVGYAQKGWDCCGVNYQYPKGDGATCCGEAPGWWCPKGFKCHKHANGIGFGCCTDDSCTVYLDGSSTITVSTSTTSSIKTTSTSSTTSVTPKATTPVSTPAVTTCNPSGPQPTFILQQTSTSDDPDNGTYAGLSTLSGNGTVSFGFTADKATSFTFNAACNLVGSNKAIADVHPPVDNTYAIVFFDTATDITSLKYDKAVCSVTSGILGCEVDEDEMWFSCNGELAIGTQAGKNCIPVVLTLEF